MRSDRMTPPQTAPYDESPVKQHVGTRLQGGNVGEMVLVPGST